MKRTIATLCLVALFAGCSGSSSLPGEVVGEVIEVPAPSTTAAPECTDEQVQTEDATRSYEPVASATDGPTVTAIRERGRLIVGVSGDTLLFGARNPLTGQLEGFDIDMVKAVARAIFATPADAEPPIEYRVITYAQRLPSLEAGDVDVVAHTMTINCRRWLRIAFSSEYFAAGQKVLVKKDSTAQSIDDLNAEGARVCAPEGSTNIDELRNDTERYGNIEVIGTADISDCLVAMQQGEADATTGDDTVLAGFAAQDPTTQVVGEQFTEEPYGLGFNRDAVDFVQFVNALLDEMRADGRLDEIYARWLVPALTTEVPAPPPAVYGRSVP